MRMNKYDLITEIAMLCDERDAYKREFEDLQRGINACKTASEGDGFNATDLMCLNAGRKKIFDDCTYSWRSVEAWRDEDTGEIKVTSFEKFREKAFSRCPDSMSKRDFFEYFDADFRAKYEEDKARAIENLKEGEDD